MWRCPYLAIVNQTGSVRNDTLEEEIFLFDLTTRRCVGALSTEYFYDIEFSQDEKWIAVSNSSGTVITQIFEIQTSQNICEIDGIRLAFHPTNNFLAVYNSGDLSLWSVDDCQRIFDMNNSAFSNTLMDSLTFIPDGSLLVAGCSVGLSNPVNFI
jgi:WD40 repeat protein